jgi:hypothetical protein
MWRHLNNETNVNETSDDTKLVIRSRKSKDTQYNGQMKKDEKIGEKKINKTLRNIRISSWYS